MEPVKANPAGEEAGDRFIRKRGKSGDFELFRKTKIEVNQTTKKIGIGLFVLAALSCAFWAFAQQGAQAPGGAPPAAGGGSGRSGGLVRTKIMLIAWNNERNRTSPHQSANNAMAQMERMGYETGFWDTYIRSDSNMISFNPKMTAGQPNNSGINLSKAESTFRLRLEDISDPMGQADYVIVIMKLTNSGGELDSTGVKRLQRHVERSATRKIVE